MFKNIVSIIKSCYMKLLAIILITQEIPPENNVLLLLTHI